MMEIFGRKRSSKKAAMRLFSPGMKDAQMADPRDPERLIRQIHQLEAELRGLKYEAVGLRSDLEAARKLYGFVSSLGVSASLGESLRLIADNIRRFFAADGSCLAKFDSTSDNLSVCASSGKAMENSLARGFSYNLLAPSGREQAGIFQADTEDDPLISEIIRTAGMVSCMRVPVGSALDCFGLVYVFSKTASFSPAGLECLALLTRHAAAEIQRGRTEQLLRESEERFRFMAETTGDVIYRLKYDTMTYDYMSPGISRLTGYSKEEIEEFGFARLVLRIDTPSGKNVSLKAIVKSREQGKTREFRADYLLETRSGELRWVRDHSFPWYDESGGEIIGSVGILSDVSEYKRAEARIEQRTEELIESEEKYRTLVENVPLVVYRMRPIAHVFFINPFVEQVFGFSAGEILRDPELWPARVHPEDLSRVTALRDVSFKEGRHFLAEYRVIHKNGHLVYVLDHAVPFRSAKGHISSLDGIIMDMTGRVKLQEQLLQAEGMKTISEVSQRLAHEIRNPLVSAGGFARLLLSSMASGDPNRDKVEIIVREVARLESILRMTINYLQPLELKQVPTNVDHLLHTVLQKLAQMIEEKRIEIVFRPAAQLPPAMLDPVLMEQALRALVYNAVHHTPVSGSITFSITHEGDFIKLLIDYQAQHLSRDDVEHFFYPFTTSQFGPSDPDLPMSKIIITKHEGQVSIQSTSANQITLTVALPLWDRPSQIATD